MCIRDRKIYEIDKQFSPNPNFILEQNITNFDSLSQSNIMISDWSGIALEFAFTFERPILYVDVPKKILNPDFSEILHTPIEESIRNQIGIVICKSDIESIPKKIEELCNNTEVMRNQIRKAREDTVFNIGKSNKIGAEQIIELLLSLIHI